MQESNYKNRIADKMPSVFFPVVTAVGKYAFRRADGVYVVPIGSMKD